MKNDQRIEIAVYGKGGIGKSTVSANLSAALAQRGQRVLQIGCDPKHDSTRMLMHGEQITTVLAYLKDHDKNTGKLEDVLHQGYLQIGCVEAGGPRPGVGCAGRGIISAFEFLDMHMAKEAYDLCIYDVLGDVVCGGFAVPVRREYADVIFLVTSGEYMALYAANNILRGIRSYDEDRYKRVAGIIYNERRLDDEDGRVQRFARAVGLPVCAKVPRSDAFAYAEQAKMTVMEMAGCEAEKTVFSGIAGMIRSDMTLYPACPLSDDELEQVVLQTQMAESEKGAEPEGAAEPEKGAEPEAAAKLPEGEGKTQAACASSIYENIQNTVTASAPAKRPPLYGCAFNGAATAAVHLTDAIVIAHSPRACAFYTWQNISSPGRKNLYNRGILMPSAISPNFMCTDMGQSEAVFGGMDTLRDAVRSAMEKKPGAIVVISSCVSGIIGDDIESLHELKVKNDTEIPIITIGSDGVIAGDYMEGIRLCMRRIGEALIDPTVKPEGRLVNLVNETGVSNNSELNYRIVRDLLGALGIQINARYLGDATCREMKEFLKAPLNILTTDSADGRQLQEWLENTYGCRFARSTLPIGFQETKRWLYEIAEAFSCVDMVPAVIAEEEIRYQEKIENLRPYLQGKKLLITTINSSLDWLLESADDLGMEVTWIGVLNYLRTPLHISVHEKFSDLVSEDVDVQTIRERIAQTQPDIVLSNYTSLIGEGDYVSDTLSMTQTAGFQSGIHVMQRWAELLTKRETQRKAEKGGWLDDRQLFEKYFG